MPGAVASGAPTGWNTVHRGKQAAQLKTKAWGGAWVGYYPLGGLLTSTPSVITWWRKPAAGRLRRGVASTRCTASGGTVRRGARTKGSVKTWRVTGGHLASSELIDVFFRGRDNHLYQSHTTARPGFQSSTSAADNIPIRCSSWGLRRLDLFREGDDDALQRRSCGRETVDALGEDWRPDRRHSVRGSWDENRMR